MGRAMCKSSVKVLGFPLYHTCIMWCWRRIRDGGAARWSFSSRQHLGQHNFYVQGLWKPMLCGWRSLLPLRLMKLNERELEESNIMKQRKCSWFQQCVSRKLRPLTLVERGRAVSYTHTFLYLHIINRHTCYTYEFLFHIITHTNRLVYIFIIYTSITKPKTYKWNNTFN